MNYDCLFSFVTFAEQVNFTKAARLLHITQPALHAQITKLADEVGFPLYRREGRALQLTEEGRRLAAYGREVRARGADVLAELRNEKASAPLVLASGQGAFLHLLGAVIQKFPKERWPLQLVSLSGPETVRAVREARADVGVAVVTEPIHDLESKTLRRVGQLVLVPRGHRLAKRRRLSPADLDSKRLVVAPEGSPHRRMLGEALATAGARWSVAVEATGWGLMLEFARCGIGIAVVNDFCPVPRGLVGVKLEGVPDVEYRVLTRPQGRREAQEALLGLLARL
ncbi:MAG: LysR family transcriptional regulator [Polyangiaceae bacterium]